MISRLECHAQIDSKIKLKEMYDLLILNKSQSTICYTLCNNFILMLDDLFKDVEEAKKLLNSFNYLKFVILLVD